nr:unnamed protein product [Callosobruchus chinensis]
MNKKRRKKKTRVWVREWIEKREQLGALNNLVNELRDQDEMHSENFLRMKTVDFDYLLEKVSSRIRKKDTSMRRAITPKERLIITLRYLATGDSYRSLMYLFRVPANTISLIIPEVCQAIYDVLKDKFLKANWDNIADDFMQKWNFPNCVGAIDGKHVNLKAPANSGSLNFNYKHSHSIVLLGLADANYQFTYINVGSAGRNSDGGVYVNSRLSKALENNSVNIPQPKPLPGRRRPVPYVVMVADDAFALKPYMLKPLAFKNQGVAERIFNYRLSRARRITENVFGIVPARFRVLRRNIELSEQKATQIVCAVCVLHNFIMSRKQSALAYAPNGTFDVDNEDGTITPGSVTKLMLFYQGW